MITPVKTVFSQPRTTKHTQWSLSTFDARVGYKVYLGLKHPQWSRTVPTRKYLRRKTSSANTAKVFSEYEPLHSVTFRYLLRVRSSCWWHSFLRCMDILRKQFSWSLPLLINSCSAQEMVTWSYEVQSQRKGYQSISKRSSQSKAGKLHGQMSHVELFRAHEVIVSAHQSESYCWTSIRP